MIFEDTWDQFVSGKIEYSNFSDHGWVMAVNASAETYDVVIGERELLENGEVDPAKIYRSIKSTVPFSVVQFEVNEPVLIGYLNGDRNKPLVLGASDNIIMDVTKVSINPDEEKYIYAVDQADGGTSRVHVYTVDGSYVRTIQIVHPSGEIGGSVSGLGIAIDSVRKKYFVVGGVSGVIVVRCFNFSDTNLFDITIPTSTTPIDVAVDESSGDIYVSYRGTTPPGSRPHKVVCYDTAGTYKHEWGGEGTGDTQFGGVNGPRGLDVRDGYVYVVDNGNTKVKKFDLLGNFVKDWTYGSVLVRTPADGYLYHVYDNTIFKRDDAGTLLETIGGFGTGDGKHISIAGADVGRSGRVYTLDHSSSHPKKIQVFENDGTFVMSFGVIGTGDGEFKYDASGQIGGLRVY